MGKLFFIGDSITTGAWDTQGGWAARLIGQIMDLTIKGEFKEAGFYCLPYNLGVSGNNLINIAERLEAEVQARLDQDCPDEKIQLVFSAGVNDTLFLMEEQRPSFTDAQFRDNLDSVIKIAQGLAHDIAFIGLLPVDEDKLCPIPWAPDEAYANIYVERFENIIRDTCYEHGIKFLPLYAGWREMENFTKYLLDGVHPNPEGHALLTEQIGKFLLTDEFVKLHSEI